MPRRDIGEQVSVFRFLMWKNKSWEIVGYSFYYADQRTAEGAPVGTNIQGDAHAEFYSELVKGSEARSYLQTFVKDKGYVKF